MKLTRYSSGFLFVCLMYLGLTTCGRAGETVQLSSLATRNYSAETRGVNRWSGGYQGAVYPRSQASSAPATSFRLELSSSQAVALDSLWGGTTQDSGRRYVITSPKSLDLNRDETHEIGFIVRRPQAEAQAKLTVNTQPSAPSTPTPAGLTPAPTSSSPFYVDPDSGAASWVRDNASDPRAALIRTEIASQPQGKWVGDWTPNVKQTVSAYAGAAAAAGKIPIFVAYNIPGRDCGQFSSGGAGSAEAYRAWIRDFAGGLAQRQAVVVLEPDALPLLLDCQQGTNTKLVTSLLSFAVDEFSRSAPNTKVYLDAGNSNWKSAADMATRLKAANIAKAAGFALNTSNYRTTAESRRYGDDIVKRLGGQARFVIDTSRNGAGPGDDWCNPAGRKLGVTSRKVAGNTGLEFLLWVKAPGESDGDCGVGQGSAAGDFLPDVAFKMAE